MEEYEPKTGFEENIDISYDISILDDIYELSIGMNESSLEFILKQKNIIDEYYYKAKFDLNLINKLMNTSFGRIKEAFNFFDNLLKNKKVKLIKSNDKNIIKLNFINIIQKNESNVELNKYKLSKDEMNLMFLKEIDTIKKKLDSTKEKSFDELIKESNKQLKEYIDKIIEETKQKYDEIFGENN